MRSITQDEERAATLQVDKGVAPGNPRRDAWPRPGALPKQIRRVLANPDAPAKPADAARVLRQTGVWDAFIVRLGRIHNGKPWGMG